MFEGSMFSLCSSGTLAQRAMVTLRQLEGAWGAKQTPFVYEKAREKKRGRGRERVV